jgi:hypothetical protein
VLVNDDGTGTGEGTGQGCHGRGCEVGENSNCEHEIGPFCKKDLPFLPSHCLSLFPYEEGEG